MPILTLKFAGQGHAEIVNVHIMLSRIVKHTCQAQRDLVQTQIHGENIILILTLSSRLCGGYRYNCM